MIDTSEVWPTVWRAVSCHQSQFAAYERLRDLPPDHHRTLWGRQSFYRAYSIVNGGRTRETDEDVRTHRLTKRHDDIGAHLLRCIAMRATASCGSTRSRS